MVDIFLVFFKLICGPMLIFLCVHTIIAATAKQHNLIVATRNIADFKGFEVKLLNPFDGITYF